MKVTLLKISDLKLIEPDVFEDERGFFYESFNQKKFNEAIGQEIIFVQDNHSKSKKGVLRGLHYQEDPFMQDKLVRVIQGKIFDIAVDIRRDSDTFGKWVSQVLSSKNKYQLWIPKGFAHGFVSLTENAEVIYKTTNYYSPKHEKVIKFNDERFKICWPKIDHKFNISKRDLDQ